MFGFLRSRPLKAVIAEIDSISQEWGLSGMAIVRPHFDRSLLTHQDALVLSLSSGECSARQIAVAQLANSSGDLLETGTLHLYRGVLSPAGDNVMAVFRRALTEMVTMGFASEADVAEQITCVSSIISQVG